MQNTGGKRKEGILISDVTVGIAPETEGIYANVTKQSHVCLHYLLLTSLFRQLVTKYYATNNYVL